MRIRCLTVIICDEFFVEFHTLHTLPLESKEKRGCKKHLIPPDYQIFFPSIKLDDKLHVVLAMTAVHVCVSGLTSKHQPVHNEQITLT